jgi:hypothetical protein
VYSKRIVDLTLDDFEHRRGWRPQPHSLEEVSRVNEMIEKKLKLFSNKLGNSYEWMPGKEPSVAEAKWIKQWCANERFLCFADAEYFLTRYCKIRAVDERIINFEMRLGQAIYFDMLRQYDDEQLAIQLFCLKCRQVGISTFTALLFLHRILFRSNTHAIMASAQVEQSNKLSIIVDTAWERLPFWMPPAKSSLKAKEPKWENGSAMSIQAGSQTVGIAQGSTPTCIHLSEIADYDNPTKTIEEGLFPAAHQTSALFFVMEGTGATASPWQKDKWNEYKANWGQGARFRTVFIPPSCASDIYPHPDWLRGNPIPEDWNPIIETIRMKRRAELFVQSTDYLRAFLGEHWQMGPEYMWYWELGWKEAVKSKSTKTFLAMNAVTDVDAFQSKFDPVFNDEVIEIVTKEAERKYQAYAITGKTILMGQDATVYEPSTHEIDYDSERIPIRWEANDGNTYEWELVPLQPFDDSTDEACYDKLLVFEAPRANAKYSEGIDNAYGLNIPDEDRGTLSVLRNEYGKDRDCQVASFTSIRVNSAQMGRIAAAVATYFTTCGTDWGGQDTDDEGRIRLTTSNPMGMRLIAEQITGPGDDCYNQMVLMGFFDWHLMHRYDDKDIKPNQGKKVGWYTSEWSRPILLGKFVDYVNTGWFKPNDPILIRQLSTFVRRKVGDDKARLTHDKGEHDDNIFATAMALLTAHDIEPETSRLQNRFNSSPPPTTASEGWYSHAVSID